MSFVLSHPIATAIGSSYLEKEYQRQALSNDPDSDSRIAAINKERQQDPVLEKKTRELEGIRSELESLKKGEQDDCIIHEDHPDLGELKGCLSEVNNRIKDLTKDIYKYEQCADYERKGIKSNCSSVVKRKGTLYREIMGMKNTAEKNLQNSETEASDISKQILNKKEDLSGACKERQQHVPEAIPKQLRELELQNEEVSAYIKKLNALYDERIDQINKTKPDIFDLTELLHKVVFKDGKYAIGSYYLALVLILFFFDMSPVILKSIYTGMYNKKVMQEENK